MELVRDARGREQPYAQVARLLLRHTYLPKAQMDFAGSSYFGGKEDQLVLCAGKGTFLVMCYLHLKTPLMHARTQRAISTSGIAIVQLCSITLDLLRSAGT